MKKLYFPIVLFSLLASVFVSCSNDDEPTVDPIHTSMFEKAEDFVDQRDGHVYKCIKVGDQIWMAENLAYYPDMGSIGGCFTWNEELFLLKDLELSMDEWKAALIEFGDGENSKYKAGVDVWGMPFHVASIIQSGEGFCTTKKEILDSFEWYSWSATYPDFMSEWAKHEVKLLNDKKFSAIRENMEAADKANGEYSKRYGYLYSLDAARKAVPEGWRLPTDADWKKLETALGMSAEEVEKCDAWRGVNAGTYLKQGGVSMFNAQLGGCNAYQPQANSEYYIKLNEGGYFWTDDERITNVEVTDEDTEATPEGEGDTEAAPEEGGLGIDKSILREGMYRFVTIYSPQIWRGVIRVDNGFRYTALSVRCVKDAK